MTCYARLHATCAARVPRADVRVLRAQPAYLSAREGVREGYTGCVAHARTNKTENNNRRVRRRLMTLLRSRREREQTLLTESLPRIVCIYSAYFYDIYFPPRRDTAPRQSQPAVCSSFLEPRENRKKGTRRERERERERKEQPRS